MEQAVRSAQRYQESSGFHGPYLYLETNRVFRKTPNIKLTFNLGTWFSIQGTEVKKMKSESYLRNESQTYYVRYNWEHTHAHTCTDNI